MWGLVQPVTAVLLSMAASVVAVVVDHPVVAGIHPVAVQMEHPVAAAATVHVV